MKNHPVLRSMLSHLAKSATEPEEIDLWPAIQSRLATHKSISCFKETDMNRKRNTASRTSLSWIGASILVLVFGIVFTLPFGRAWAQAIVKFFTITEDITFQLPTQDGAAAVPDPANVITQAPCSQDNTLHNVGCAVENAEAALGFHIRELPTAPVNFTFTHASADATLGQFSITYVRDGGELVIRQTFASTAVSSWENSWGAVPADTVETVEINGVEGEYVRGMFVVKSPIGTKAEWEPDAPVQRLRWREGEILFEIQMQGLPGDNTLIGKEWLLSLAEQLK